MSGSSFQEREARVDRLLRSLSDHVRAGQPDGPWPAFGRYEVRAQLGEGSTAVVYQAWDRELQRPVALKVLKPRLEMHEIARQRFRRESQAAAAILHPHIIQVHDVGEENGRLFIVMEHVVGRSLNELLQGPPKPLPERVRILHGVAEGVAAAHARGVVHRDLKPANILVTDAGEPKVADFGLAHLLDSSVELTRTGAALGTPLYMSPEQVRGRSKEVTPRTDVYALGAVLYELLAGRPPHLADTPLELYERILNEEPVPPRRIRPDVPEDLETIALKAISKDPSGRYPTAHELAEDLRRTLAGERILARPPSTLDGLRRAVGRRRKALLAASAAALLLAFAWALGSPSHAASVLAVSGEVTRGGEPGGATIAPGEALARGQMLRTGPSGRAVLETREGARLTLGSGTLIQPIDRGVWFLAYGTVQGEGAGRLSVRSPHARAETDGGAVRLEVSAASSWIESVQGAVRVTRADDGRQELVPAGSFIVAGAGRDFSARPVAQGLLGYWPFEDAEANVARDASGRGHDGVFIRPPAAAPGHKGKAAGLEAGNYLEVPGLSGAGFPRSGTLSFWAKGDFRSQPYTDLFDTYEERRNHVFARAVKDIPGLQVVFQADDYRFQHLLPIAEDQWNHIVVVWDSERQAGALYLNGSLSYSGPFLAPSWSPDGQFFRFGGVGNLPTAFRGALDEIRLYGQPLGAEAVRDLHER